MNQLTLGFDTPASISRKSDPITSQKSAAEFQKKLKGAKAACMFILNHYTYPLTAREIANRCVQYAGGFESSYRARPSELVKDGFVEECGERKCEVTGKSAMTFRVKEQHLCREN
jgi:hypothetical protein